MRKLIAALAWVACACLLVPAVAAGRVDDVAATRAYLRAADVYELGAFSEVGSGVAAIEARSAAIGGECPSVLTYAPRDGEFRELGEEINGALLFTGVLTAVDPMMLRLAHAIGGLAWSDRRLTRLVHAVAAEERVIVRLVLPDVCADIAEWKASAYAALPQSAAGFLARVQAIESMGLVGSSEESREALIMRLLRPYEGARERRTVKQIERLEGQIGKRWQAAASAARSRLAAALGVSAL